MWEPLIVTQHAVKTGGHRNCGSGDINIPEIMVILPQIQDNYYCICPLTSVIIIFCREYGMAFATRVLNFNLRNDFYENIFSMSNAISPILIARFLGNEW